MPLFAEYKLNQSAVFIWKIEESLAFFESQVDIKSSIKNKERLIEFFAGRYLLLKYLPNLDLNKIVKNGSGKPYCPDSSFEFSISHSFPYVGIALSKKPVGLDLQVYTEKVVRIKDKYMNPKEVPLFNNLLENATLIWNAKESIYKLIGTGGQTFKEDFIVQSIKKENDLINIQCFVRELNNSLSLSGKCFKDFSFTVTL